MTLFDPQPEFAEHDAFVHALLGLMVLNKRLNSLMDATLMTSGDSEKPASLAAGSQRHNDGVVLALLGLVSVNDKLQCALDHWIQDCSVHDDGKFRDENFPTEFGFDEIKDLLR